MPISPAVNIGDATLGNAGSLPGAASGESFGQMIGAAMNQVEGAQTAATQASANLLLGGNGDVHMVALASQKAELSLELFQQVRNKFVSAYQEIMKMPM